MTSSLRLRSSTGFAALAAALALSACGGNDPGTSPDATLAVDAVTCSAAPAGAASERVATSSGVVRGATRGATWAYLGIPYAAPPIGARRLAAPQPTTCAPAELDATVLGPRCPQLDDTGAFVGDEDCLQLNVWAPAAAAAPRAVMVWIHGGANVQGSAIDPIYDGRRLAEAGDVVVVTLNYRLAQLGFLAHPQLAAEGTGSGDFGLLDQIAALRWVHDNIAGFGGDPANVTIFGESAGARDVCSLVAAPPAAGLFARAIMESGSCKALPTRAQAEATGADVADAAGCNNASDVPACLRALPAETLVRALSSSASILSSSPYQPAIDGVVQLEQPATAIAAGRHHHVGFLIGANAQETGKAVPAIADVAAYQALVRAQFGPIADAVLAQYPATSYASPRAAYVELTTDARFVCPAREIARAMTAGQAEPVFRYFFRFASANPFGAIHALEVPFVFGNADAIVINGQPYQPSATDLAVSASMQAAWTGFARTGTPGGEPAWPRWNASDPTMVFAATPSVASGIRTADCDFWRPYYDAL